MRGTEVPRTDSHLKQVTSSPRWVHPRAVSPETASLFSAQGGVTCSPAMSTPHFPSEFQVIHSLPTTQRHERKQRGDQFEWSFLECWLWLAQCLCLPQGSPQCGTTTQNQPSVICRDNGACHPHHRVAEHTTDVINLPIKTEQTPVSF